MSKESLFKRRPRAIEIEGDTFYVRSMTLAEAIEVDRLKEAGDSIKAAQYSVARCVVSESGEPVLSEEDVPQVPMDILHRLGALIAEVSSTASRGDIRKNSDAAQS